MAKKLQLCGTEDEMRLVAGKICRKYLHGAWKTVDPADLYFSRISGGLSNFLYMVGLPDDVSKLGVYDHRDSSPDEEPDLIRRRSNSFTMEEPKKVLLRIYGQVHGERAMDAIVTESVIFTLLSERKLGPKLYGVFSGGRIEEYIPARALVSRELSDPAISMKIAEKMAAVHSMAVPLSKDPDWLWKTCYKWLKTVKDDLDTGRVKGKNEKEEKMIQLINTVDFDKELTWLKKYLATINSPVVFCHNDLQRGNILLFDEASTGQTDCDTYSEEQFKDMSVYEDYNTSDSMSSRVSDSGEPRIALIDFEYCAYNHRGFDIANHFLEWSFDYNNPDPPYFSENKDELPTLEQKEIFIKEYLKHYHINAMEGNTEPPTVDEVNQLLSEVEAFTLSCHLLWTLWSFVNAFKSKITFGYWEYAQIRIDNYYRVKQEIIKKSNGGGQKRKICEVDI